MERDELERRIGEFPRWHYRFEFDDGVATPLANVGMVNRHEQRRRYFFDALLRLYGGSLRGQRVLDLGCNAGFWSLHAVRAGADYVLGIDAQPTYVEQANLVFAASGIDPARYRFERRNVFEGAVPERFDVVLCLGLIDQVAKPVELFELMSAAGAETIVLDTGISRAASSYFELARLEEPRNAVDHEIVLLPTREAVAELAGEFGYDTVALARNITDHTAMNDYRDGRRLAFVCAKGRPLAALTAERPSPRPRWLAALDPRRRGRFTRV